MVILYHIRMSIAAPNEQGQSQEEEMEKRDESNLEDVYSHRSRGSSESSENFEDNTTMNVTTAVKERVLRSMFATASLHPWLSPSGKSLPIYLGRGNNNESNNAQHSSSNHNESSSPLPSSPSSSPRKRRLRRRRRIRSHRGRVIHHHHHHHLHHQSIRADYAVSEHDGDGHTKFPRTVELTMDESKHLHWTRYFEVFQNPSPSSRDSRASAGADALLNNHHNVDHNALGSDQEHDHDNADMKMMPNKTIISAAKRERKHLKNPQEMVLSLKPSRAVVASLYNGHMSKIASYEADHHHHHHHHHHHLRKLTRLSSRRR